MTEGWDKGLGPYTPVLKEVDGRMKLFGRGGVDDGYAFFSALMLIKAIRNNDLKHPPIVVFAETDEESGSRDIMYYL